MKKNIKNHIDSLISSKLIHIIFIFFIILIITSLYIFPGYKYTPDSFDYYGLSKTFFGDSDFYHPNTIRSYFNLEKSSAFPFLYPALLACLNIFFGDNYLNSGYYNVALMTASYCLLLIITRDISNDKLVCALFSLSILIFPGYLSEVLSGRSIPLSLFLILSSIICYNKNRPYLAMYLLGLCCLVRFDLLAAALFVAIYLSFKRKDLLLVLFCLLGMLPWIVYSKLYFNNFWISDNSWIALSSIASFVTDFPGKATFTLFNDPLNWFNRVTMNFIFGNFYYIKAAASNPLIILLTLFFIIKKDFLKVTIRQYAFLFFLLNSVLAPFFLSGYFESRYFYLPILLFGFFVFYRANVNIKKLHVALIIFPILYFPVKNIYEPYLNFNGNKEKLKNRIDDIKLLESLHFEEKHVIYFILNRQAGLGVAPMYGALTGNKVAYIPRNLSDVNLNEFNNYIGENKTINLNDYPLYKVD